MLSLPAGLATEANKMDEPIRAKHLRKDAHLENSLVALNALLAPVEERLELETAAVEPPVLFVIGMARSGTTLAAQILASAGFGYVSNFIARFWRAPAIGATLQRTVLQAGEVLASSFKSTHGVTEGWFEPHEFGYFWDRWFDLGQDSHKLHSAQLARVDRCGLHRAVSALQQVEGRPFSFKNNTWCSLQASWLAELFPRSIFVVCRRASCWVAQSLCQGREERYGSREAWWSIRPSAYPSLAGLPWWEQIAAQVVDFELEMNDELARIPSVRLIDIDYSDLCAHPRALIDRVSSLLPAMGIKFEPTVERLPERLASRNIRRLADADWQRLNEAIQQRAIARQSKVTQ